MPGLPKQGLRSKLFASRIVNSNLHRVYVSTRVSQIHFAYWPCFHAFADYIRNRIIIEDLATESQINPDEWNNYHPDTKKLSLYNGRE